MLSLKLIIRKRGEFSFELAKTDHGGTLWDRSALLGAIDGEFVFYSDRKVQPLGNIFPNCVHFTGNMLLSDVFPQYSEALSGKCTVCP